VQLLRQRERLKFIVLAGAARAAEFIDDRGEVGRLFAAAFQLGEGGVKAGGGGTNT